MEAVYNLSLWVIILIALSPLFLVSAYKRIIRPMASHAWWNLCRSVVQTAKPTILDAEITTIKSQGIANKDRIMELREVVWNNLRAGDTVTVMNAKIRVTEPNVSENHHIGVSLEDDRQVKFTHSSLHYIR